MSEEISVKVDRKNIATLIKENEKYDLIYQNASKESFVSLTMPVRKRSYKSSGDKLS